MTALVDHDLATLEHDPWFSQLSCGCQKALLARATVVSFDDEARVYRVADDPNGLWAVLSGQVRLIGYPSAGIELLALIISQGEWFGELSMIDGKPRPHDAIAFGCARVLHVSPAAYASAAALQPDLVHDLALLLCARQRLAMSVVADHLAQPLSVRLARTLARQSFATHNSKLAIGQEALAMTLNTSRQTLNRALQRLVEMGAIAIGYRSIEIVDRTKLEECGGKSKQVRRR